MTGHNWGRTGAQASVKLERHIECWQKCWEQGSAAGILEMTWPICHEVQLLLSGRGGVGGWASGSCRMCKSGFACPQTPRKRLDGKIRPLARNPLVHPGERLKTCPNLEHESGVSLRVLREVVEEDGCCNQEKWHHDVANWLMVNVWVAFYSCECADV